MSIHQLLDFNPFDLSELQSDSHELFMLAKFVRLFDTPLFSCIRKAEGVFLDPICNVISAYSDIQTLLTKHHWISGFTSFRIRSFRPYDVKAGTSLTYPCHIDVLSQFCIFLQCSSSCLKWRTVVCKRVGTYQDDNTCSIQTRPKVTRSCRGGRCRGSKTSKSTFRLRFDFIQTS